MMQNKKIVGITGGSGCGKSYVSDLLRNRGIPVIDADKIGHLVTNSDEDCKRELSKFFGDDIYENGILNRKKLGGIVFSNPEKLEKLNEISHKYILKCIDNKIRECDGEIVCIDGAVLIESGIKCDLMVGVLAHKNTRLERIINRDGISKDAAIRRIDAQKSDDFYFKNCDFVIFNDGEIDIEKIIKRIAE